MANELNIVKSGHDVDDTAGKSAGERGVLEPPDLYRLGIMIGEYYVRRKLLNFF
jgi:hypothetical protein